MIKNSFIILILCIFIGNPAFAGLSCFRLYPLSETSWQTLQRVDQQKLMPWLHQDLAQAIGQLPKLQAWRLKRLLASYRPQSDFLFERNIEAFTEELTQIFEGHKLLHENNLDESVDSFKILLDRVAREQVLRENVQQFFLNQKLPNSTKEKLYRTLGFLRHHPLALMLTFRIPLVRSQNLPDFILDSILKSNPQIALSTLERAYAREEISLAQLRTARKFTQYVINVAFVYLLYQELKEALEQNNSRIDHDMDTYFAKHKEKKAVEITQAENELQALQEKMSLKETHPQQYYYNLYLEAFKTEYHREPTATEDLDLKAAAQSLSQSTH